VRPNRLEQRPASGRPPGWRLLGALAVPLLLSAACDDDSFTPRNAQRGTPPWERTEQREPCADFTLTRSPYFGDLHVHTRYSADAYISGTRGTPRDAYAFARGARVVTPDENEAQTREVEIDRPLDFAAVTDHSEFIGEVTLCIDPTSAAYDAEICQQLRGTDDSFEVTVNWLFPAGIENPPPSLPFCAELGLDCDAAAVSAWADIQAAAEEAYDRTSACSFTTFIGYEHTASLLGRHMHRNVIFRNEHVPLQPASYLETARDGIPQGVWKAIEEGCLDAGFGCDAVIIPHNSNLSDGQQFVDPLDAADARRRSEREPLAEIFQLKGNSECRFDRLAGRGVDTEDELCAFEQLRNAHQIPGVPPPSIDDYPRRNLVRNALKDGLVFEEQLGANPFQFGLIGSTDNHNAIAGAVIEGIWSEAQGSDGATPAFPVWVGRSNNPGGLAVVWAEENSRDAIFSALRRRETYATSGIRPIVRFFAGPLTDVSCDRPDLVELAYEQGTPMGGKIGPVDGSRAPRFVVHALADAGVPGRPGAPLQRVQIIKGWVGSDGEAHEKVVDVAGSRGGGGVGPDCSPLETGARELCVVWEDPEFDPRQRSFYYARVLEVPTCRWNTILCRQAGVDPLSSSCAEQARAAGEDYADCCPDPAGEAFYDPLTQERAWTSPIWYRPEGIAATAQARDRSR
jgi:Protein of unknown function (DUF3604)